MPNLLRGPYRALFAPRGKVLAVTKAINAIPGLIDYYPHQERLGTDLIAYDANGLAPGLNGTINSTTIGVTATDALGLCHSFDGINDYNQLPAAALDSAMTKPTGTISIFAKLPASDATTTYLYRIGDNTSANFFAVSKDPSGNKIGARVKTQGDFNTTTYVYTPGVWFNVILTWEFDSVNTNYKVYIDGIEGAALASTALAYNPTLADITTVIGAFVNSPASLVEGELCHMAIYDNAINDNSAISIALGGDTA